MEIGLRSDGGDGETGTGLEVGGALSYRNAVSGLTLEVRARTLTAHSGDTEEWGVGGMIRKEPGGAAGRGLSLTLAPTLGIVDGGVEKLWSAGVADDDGLADAEARLVSEVGYGLPVMDGRGLLTPNAGFTFSEGGARTYRAGGRLAIGPSTSLSLEGTHREVHGDQDAEHALMLRASLVW